MSQWITERRFSRCTIHLPLAHKAGTSPGRRIDVGWTRNLSEGGACVELADDLQTQMPVQMRLQTTRGPIQVGGQVVWVGDAARSGGGVPHGVTLTQVFPDQRRAIRTLISRRVVGGVAQVRLPFQVPVTCRRRAPHTGRPLEGQTGDVSRGGLLLLLPEVLQVGAELELTLHTPAGPLTVAGEIAWVESPGGQLLGAPFRHGFRFQSLAWPTALALGWLLTEPL